MKLTFDIPNETFCNEKRVAEREKTLEESGEPGKKSSRSDTFFNLYIFHLFFFAL